MINSSTVTGYSGRLRAVRVVQMSTSTFSTAQKVSKIRKHEGRKETNAKLCLRHIADEALVVTV